MTTTLERCGGDSHGSLSTSGSSSCWFLWPTPPSQASDQIPVPSVAVTAATAGTRLHGCDRSHHALRSLTLTCRRAGNLMRRQQVQTCREPAWTACSWSSQGRGCGAVPCPVNILTDASENPGIGSMRVVSQPNSTEVIFGLTIVASVPAIAVVWVSSVQQVRAHRLDPDDTPHTPGLLSKIGPSLVSVASFGLATVIILSPHSLDLPDGSRAAGVALGTFSSSAICASL